MFDLSLERRARVRRIWTLLVRGASTTLSLSLGFASVVLLALFGLALATGFYVPLLSDEVATKLSNSRVFEEQGNVVSLLPMCSSSWIQSVPSTLYPGAVLLTLAYGYIGLVGIKVTGIAFSLAAIAGVAWLACRGLKKTADRLSAVAGLCAISCLGVMPFVLILSRSEQVMKLCLVGYCVLPVIARSWAHRQRARVILGVAFLLLSSLFFYAHPKALFFLPFVLTSAVLTAPPGRRARWSAILAPCVLVMAFQCYRISASVVRCDEAPGAAQWFADAALRPRSLVTEPGTFMRAGWNNVVNAPPHAWDEVLFSASNTMWVPLPNSRRLPPEVRDLNEQTRPVFIALFWGIPLLLLFAYRRQGTIARSNTALGLALVISIGANVFFYKTFPFYNCALVMPALSLVAALALSVDNRRLIPLVPRAVGRIALLAFLVLAGQNLVALMGLFGPTLRANAKRIGPTVPDQPLALPIFGFDVEKAKIRALARACAIDGDGATHLVIDDYTVHAFEHLKQPLDLIYITDGIPWLGRAFAGEKIRPFLTGLNSPGMIGRCSLFPKVLRPTARVSEEYCCVGKTAFEPPPAR